MVHSHRATQDHRPLPTVSIGTLPYSWNFPKYILQGTDKRYTPDIQKLITKVATGTYTVHYLEFHIFTMKFHGKRKSMWQESSTHVPRITFQVLQPFWAVCVVGTNENDIFSSIYRVSSPLWRVTTAMNSKHWCKTYFSGKLIIDHQPMNLH